MEIRYVQHLGKLIVTKSLGHMSRAKTNFKIVDFKIFPRQTGCVNLFRETSFNQCLFRPACKYMFWKLLRGL